MEALQREKLLQEVKSPYLADLIPQAIPPHREWIGTRLNIFSFAYNTRLVKKEELPRTWDDLLQPRWKGKIISRDFRVPGPGSGNARMFYYMPDVGPGFLKKLYGEMDVTLFRDYRQGTDWLAVGKAAICFFCDVDISKSQGLPVDTFGPGVFKEGGGLVQLFSEEDSPLLEAYFVYPEELKSVARVQAFRDFLVSKAQRWNF